MLDLQATFRRFTADYGKFDRVQKPLHSRPDLCAFLLLDRLVPGEGDIVTAAEHDEFFLATNCDELAKVATEDDILTLVRCGVSFSVYDCLRMSA